MDTTNYLHTNHLINESSPYLLQHAHNPVEWYPWCEEALTKAKKENKLLLISIGYAACHWCHVMEHESFEDEAVAKLMNERFVCIKVDREERPDIDQVYMAAVQLMTRGGGWPLNCFALADGRPVYGGTYFPKEQWKEILVSLSDFYARNPEKAMEYATELMQGIKKTELIKVHTGTDPFTSDSIHKTVEAWTTNFDHEDGGMQYVPKFPMPNNYQFLLHYYKLTGDKSILKFVTHTLDMIAFGGIYDQAGGGFSRYSTDKKWKVPHFEKMLYDNAQLITLYSEAYVLTKKKLYRDVVYETLEFIQREMTSPEGGFFSSLDADSEGEEGKYYVWNKEQLKVLPEELHVIASEYYSVNKHGYWENGNYILLKTVTDEEFARKHGLNVELLEEKILEIKRILLEERSKRIKPGLDDKQLCSWNAMMLKAYTDAYKVFDDKKFIEAALRNSDFILSKFVQKNGHLLHNYKNQKSTINGFLEDYAFTIDAFINLYLVTSDEKHLEMADKLCTVAVEHFSDKDSGMFYFTADYDSSLIIRKMEIYDNVIPASNSQMAKNLFLLGTLLSKRQYIDRSEKMLRNVTHEMGLYISGHSNWGQLYLNFCYPFYEVVLYGPDAEVFKKEIYTHYLPNAIILSAREQTELPLMQNRYIKGKTVIYVCKNGSCLLPVENVSEAISQMK